MKRLRNLALAATCTLATLVWLTSKLSWDFFAPACCNVLFSIPFTEKVAHLPGWMYPVTIVLLVVSSLAVVTLWIAAAVKAWRLRRG